VLADARPLVFLELHGPEAANTAWKIFPAADYRLCYLKPGYPEIASFEALDWKAYLVAFPPGFVGNNRKKSSHDESSQ
jgi:hypothetical protein